MHVYPATGLKIDSVKPIKMEKCPENQNTRKLPLKKG